MFLCQIVFLSYADIDLKFFNHLVEKNNISTQTCPPDLSFGQEIRVFCLSSFHLHYSFSLRSLRLCGESCHLSFASFIFFLIYTVSKDILT